MPATDVRLIVLATVRHLEPATGYAIRKRLIEQGVEAWGGVSVASIYSVLRTLTKHGQLEELDDPTGVRRNTKALDRLVHARRHLRRGAWIEGLIVVLIALEVVRGRRRPLNLQHPRPTSRTSL